jgi:hypothetical protein
VLQRRKPILQYLILVIVGLLLAACSNPKPIDTSALTTFTHHTGVFSLQVPQAWKPLQSDSPTEALAVFPEPDGQAELIAYTGLLDRRLTETEGQQIIDGLIRVLLKSPGDLRITDQQRQPDGAYTANLSFTQNGEKRSGTAHFRAEPLALSGIILSGPETNWTNLLTAMRPALDSFKVNLDYIQGTYFTPTEGELYALVIPIDWETLPAPGFKRIRSRNGLMQIVIAESAQEKTLTANELADQGVKLGMKALGQGTHTGTEQLPDGRVKVSIEQGTDSTIGYLDQKDGSVIGLFFQVPTDRLTDYQPIIDFMYSTYITGKS